MGIGKAVENWRAKRGLSRHALGMAAGLSHSHIKNIEESKSSPTWETIAAIASALSLPPIVLLGLEIPEEAEDVAVVMAQLPEEGRRMVRRLALTVLEDFPLVDERRVVPA